MSNVYLLMSNFWGVILDLALHMTYERSPTLTILAQLQYQSFTGNWVCGKQIIIRTKEGLGQSFLSAYPVSNA